MEHTSRDFERELKTLRERLLAMGGRAELQIVRAVDSLIRRDDALAASVVADEVAIDQDEIDIDELAFLILCKRQPVASDLRFVMLALKVVTDLERIGDMAVNIAKRQRDLAAPAEPQLQADLKELVARVQRALRLALESFMNADAVTAENVIRDDTEIDRLNVQFISTLLSGKYMNAAESARVLTLSSVSRYLERIGDHATNIAEMVIYYVRGRDVRHHLGPALPKPAP